MKQVKNHVQQMFNVFENRGYNIRYLAHYGNLESCQNFVLSEKGKQEQEKEYGAEESCVYRDGNHVPFTWDIEEA